MRPQLGRISKRHLLHWMMLGTCVLNAILVAMTGSLKLVAPLLKKLAAEPA
jgi:hypothetical protein